MRTETADTGAGAGPGGGAAATAAVGLGGLGRRSVRGGVLTIGSQAGQVAIGVASIMVLARVLTPRDFGLFAMVGVLTEFVSSFRDFGIPMAAISGRDVSAEQFDRLFWVSVRLSALLAVGVAAMGPVLAWLFGEPNLMLMVPVIALAFFLNGLTILHVGILRREMRFGAITAADLSAAAAGAGVGVACAFAGLEHWSLVAMYAVMLVVQGVGYWLACPWRPSGWGVRGSGTKGGGGATDIGALSVFAREATFARIVNNIGRILDRTIVGFAAGATQLGLYQNAYRWAVFPVMQVHQPLLAVMVASLSRAREEPERYAAYARTALLAVYSVIIPPVALLLVAAPEAIRVLLGPQWGEAVPIFRVLLLAALALSGSLFVKWFYYAEGKTRRQLRFSFAATGAAAVGVAVGSAWGAIGVAAGYAVAVALVVVPEIVNCLRDSVVRPSVFARAVMRPGAAAVVAGACAAGLLEVMTGGASAVRLAAAAGVFGVAYAGVWAGLPGGVGELRPLLAFVRGLRCENGHRRAGE